MKGEPLSENLLLAARAIDCLTLCGAGRFNQFEYATPEEAVEDRARLGIRRGFLVSMAAEALSPLDAAKSLTAFCQSAPVRGRFFPLFTLQPNEFFSKGAMSAWRGLLEENPTHIFQLSSEGREDRLRLGLQFLQELCPKKRPVVLISMWSAPPIGALIETALRSPQISFVLTEASWGSDTYVHAAMREASNVLADTSLSHAADRAEIFCERYGAGRILLTLGHRAVGGAALGAVLRARISVAEKEAILFRNISELCGIPEPSALPEPKFEPTEWKSFLEVGYPGQEIIDCHGHFGPVAAWAVRDQEESVQIPRKLAEMSEQRLRYFIFSHLRALLGHPLEGNKITEKQVLEANDPRLLAYFVYNPRYAEELEPFLARVPQSKVFIGFKVLCSYWKVRVDDARFEPMWKIANEFCLPVLIHTWGDAFNRPAMLESIASRHPQARLLLAHCGGHDDGRAEAEQVVRNHPHAYLEWCGSFFSHRPWQDTIREVGARKLLFGTDGVFHNHDWELARLLSAPLAPEDFQRILHDNFWEIISPLLPVRDLETIF